MSLSYLIELMKCAGSQMIILAERILYHQSCMIVIVCTFCRGPFVDVP